MRSRIWQVLCFWRTIQMHDVWARTCVRSCARAFVSLTKRYSFGSLRLFSFVTWIIDLKNLHIDHISETPINPNIAYMWHVKQLELIVWFTTRAITKRIRNVNRADGRYCIHVQVTNKIGRRSFSINLSYRLMLPAAHSVRWPNANRCSPLFEPLHIWCLNKFKSCDCF